MLSRDPEEKIGDVISTKTRSTMMGDTMFNQPLDQHLINLAICVGILLVVDHGALKPYLKAHPKELKPSHVTQCRWFLIRKDTTSMRDRHL